MGHDGFESRGFMTVTGHTTVIPSQPAEPFALLGHKIQPVYLQSLEVTCGKLCDGPTATGSRGVVHATCQPECHDPCHEQFTSPVMNGDSELATTVSLLIGRTKLLSLA